MAAAAAAAAVVNNIIWSAADLLFMCVCFSQCGASTCKHRGGQPKTNLMNVNLKRQSQTTSIVKDDFDQTEIPNTE